MKKYLLSICAIILALSFSAFKSVPNVKKDRTTDYYWYELNVGQTQTSGDAVNDVPMDQATMIEEYVDCSDDEHTPICLVGFETEQPSGTSIAGLGEDEKIREKKN